MSDATEAAGRGTEYWRTAACLQQAATPDHGDFYTLGGELVSTLRALEHLTKVLGQQVAGYGEGRRLRDDEGLDPTCRLNAAYGDLLDAAHRLIAAERAVQRFWSEVGHIGLEDSTR